MVNGREKVALSPPRREDGDLPPMTLKISHKLIHRKVAATDKCRDFLGVPSQKVRNNCQKAPKHQVAHWSSTNYDGEFSSFSIFSQLLNDSGEAVRAGPQAQQRTAFERLWNFDAPSPS